MVEGAGRSPWPRSLGGGSAERLGYFFTSLTRIADFRSRPFEVVPVPRGEWGNGDYVAARVVDGGLPSTVCPEEEFLAALRRVLAGIVEADVDVLVAEVGASPLEPYSGDVAIRELGDSIRCTILCAVDPYSVVGVTRAFETVPDFVAGVATSTEAGIELVGKLTGLRALDLLDSASREPALRILEETLDL